MGNEEHGLVIKVLKQVVANLPFRFVIQCTRRFIHHKQLGITQ